MIDRRTVERFFEKVDIPADKQACWLWTAAKHSFGYGKFSYTDARRRDVSAHRFSYMLHFNAFALEIEVVRHMCDIPSCVNPLHLLAGTQKENITDMWHRQRSAMQNGRYLQSIECRSKLTTEQVSCIKLIHKVFGVGPRALSKLVDVNETTIGDILRGQSWKHVV